MLIWPSSRCVLHEKPTQGCRACNPMNVSQELLDDQVMGDALFDQIRAAMLEMDRMVIPEAQVTHEGPHVDHLEDGTVISYLCTLCRKPISEALGEEKARREAEFENMERELHFRARRGEGGGDV